MLKLISFNLTNKMKTYPYTAIQLIDREVKVVCNVKKKPNDESMFYKRRSESQNWGDYLLQQWQQNHEIFKFSNNLELSNVLLKELNCLISELRDKEEKQLINGIEVTCIEIKDGLAYFKEGNDFNNYQATENITKLKEKVCLYLSKRKDEKLLISKQKLYTGNDLVNEINQNTEVGIDFINRLILLGLDLFSRQKENLPITKKSHEK